jgi:hypothetical protein
MSKYRIRHSYSVVETADGNATNDGGRRFTYIEIPEQVPSLGQYFFSKNHISEIHMALGAAACNHAPLTSQ